MSGSPATAAPVSQWAEGISQSPVLMASNRGPVTFESHGPGDLVARRGAGGLVTALTHVAREVSATWVASAITQGDRRAVRNSRHLEARVGRDPIRLRYLAFDPITFERYYNHISNSILWFLHHGMWDLRHRPGFDSETRSAWQCYRDVNRGFAQAIAEELDRAGPGPVMLHDYHLALVASRLRHLVPDALCSHFTHIPWAPPDAMRILPDSMVEEIFEGMLANDLLGFQTARWAHNFMWCCEELLGAAVDVETGSVLHDGHHTSVRSYPISVDAGHVRELAASGEAARHAAWIEHLLRGRKLILRVDRMELSKNIIRGLLAYEAFLRAHPEWRGRVVHVALLYPSRQALPEYRAYEAAVLELHERINAEYGSDEWRPIVLMNEDNYVRALACLERYDVLVVNPLADGMNLVAKEGAALNRRDGVLVLSRNAGSWDELGHAALGVNPHDVTGTAQALHAALTITPEDRHARARRLREAVEGNPPDRWLWKQLGDLRRQRRGRGSVVIGHGG